MDTKDKLTNLGWNASVPPNGFFNRPASVKNNDNPDGSSSTSAEIETTPEHMNLVSGDPASEGSETTTKLLRCLNLKNSARSLPYHAATEEPARNRRLLTIQ